MAFDQVRKELVKMLAVSREGTRAVDPTAKTWASGHAAALEDAITVIDKALQAERTAQLKAAAQGRT